jgi:hypothetical protein
MKKQPTSVPNANSIIMVSVIALRRSKMRETDKMHTIDEKNEVIMSELDDLQQQLEEVKADLLMEEWEEDENDDGYGCEVPDDYASCLESVKDELNELICNRGLNL